jgi:hypothetical protein
VELICPTTQGEYFHVQGWTTQISLNRFVKFDFARTSCRDAPQGAGPESIATDQYCSIRPSTSVPHSKGLWLWIPGSLGGERPGMTARRRLVKKPITRSLKCARLPDPSLKILAVPMSHKKNGRGLKWKSSVSLGLLSL